ncbi:catechol 2,3-dioxygenase-like lactoylglutathione lyase family enzyme [Catenuloplanes nepalensis]|uniref:Catechol 2,3-dioxygenase-like lactoylglutathione lyase family enzyme n=1 Tax=Catenuloplanes nepalensis TaxID=587533 RepID=A0ABT9MUB9_9ACTN|nr:hypothetical protein [Catenuloplanes nepalensis]MDP9795041.1 catechol 2,3-dioxygenase-like lactoylglutathione lyase family enzyme [Catenuloplanes nepalensis]
MFKEWRRNRAIQRVKPGSGRPLKPYRWWQPLTRSLLYLSMPDGQDVYAVEVRHLRSDDDGYTKVQLYLNGWHHAESRAPAIFPIPGGAIEVDTSEFGLKRCHYVTDDGAEYQLVPDPRSAEGRRARFEGRHPALSRGLGAFSVVLLIVSLGLGLPQLVEPVLRIPPLVERFGLYTSPIVLPVWLNIVLGVAVALASTERALRLRYSWLDAAAN